MTAPQSLRMATAVSSPKRLAPQRNLTRGELSLSLGSLVRGFLSEPLSFKLTCLYIFFEYVRPQQVYPILDFAPWTIGSLVGAVAAFIIEGARVRSKTPLNLVIGLLLACVLGSSIVATYPEQSFDSIGIVVNWVVAFVLIANTASTERRFFYFVLLFSLWCTKMSQHGFRTWLTRGFGFASWGVTGGPGWFQNSGEFALQMGIFFPMSIYLILAIRKNVSRLTRTLLWLLPISSASSIIASSSRGGLLALAMIGFWFVIRSRHRTRTLLITAVVAPLIWLVVPEQQKARFQTAGTDQTSLTRLAYWKAGLKMANEHPVLGVGYSNWHFYYRDHFWNPSDSLVVLNAKGEPVVEVAHNSFIEVMSQTGYTGLLLYLGLLTGVWWVNAGTRRLLSKTGERGRFLTLMSLGLDAGVISIAVAGFFMSVAFYPFAWVQAAMTAALRAAAVSVSAGGRDRQRRIREPKAREEHRHMRPASATYPTTPTVNGAPLG